MKDKNFYNIGGILVLAIIVAVIVNQGQKAEQKQQAEQKRLLQQIPSFSNEELLRAYYENETKLEKVKNSLKPKKEYEESPGKKLGSALAAAITTPALRRKLKRLRKIRTELLIEMQKRGIEPPA